MIHIHEYIYSHMLHGAGIFTYHNWVILFGQM